MQLTNGSGATRSYDLVIAKYAGPNPSHIKYVDFGAASFTEYKTNSGASYGHASADGGEGVGAADYHKTPEFGTTPPALEGFSSAGGTPILYSASGARLASPELRDRVDLTAPDGTDTTFFGSDTDGNGKPNFFGTSAAAPHAAGVAALMLDAKGTLTPTQIYNALESKAIDMDNPYAAGFQTGKDVASGYGLVDASASVGAVAGGSGGGDADVGQRCDQRHDRPRHRLCPGRGRHRLRQGRKRLPRRRPRASTTSTATTATTSIFG